MITIYDITGNAKLQVEINEGSTRHFKLMEEDYVELRFSTVSFVPFVTGDYVDFRREATNYPLLSSLGRFVFVGNEYKSAYNIETGGYDYTLRLDNQYWLWANHIFKFVPATGGSEASWTLTDKPHVFLEVLLSNLVTLGLKYELDNTAVDYEYAPVPSDLADKYITLTFSNTSILDGLVAIAEKLECDFWLEDYVIHLGRCEKSENPTAMVIGEDIESFLSSEGKNDYANKFYVFGSDRNISKKYRRPLEFTGTPPEQGSQEETDGVFTCDKSLLPSFFPDSTKSYNDSDTLSNIDFGVDLGTEVSVWSDAKSFELHLGYIQDKPDGTARLEILQGVWENNVPANAFQVGVLYEDDTSDPLQSYTGTAQLILQAYSADGWVDVSRGVKMDVWFTRLGTRSWGGQTMGAGWLSFRNVEETLEGVAPMTDAGITTYRLYARYEFPTTFPKGSYKVLQLSRLGEYSELKIRGTYKNRNPKIDTSIKVGNDLYDVTINPSYTSMVDGTDKVYLDGTMPSEAFTFEFLDVVRYNVPLSYFGADANSAFTKNGVVQKRLMLPLDSSQIEDMTIMVDGEEENLVDYATEQGYFYGSGDVKNGKGYIMEDYTLNEKAVIECVLLDDEIYPSSEDEVTACGYETHKEKNEDGESIEVKEWWIKSDKFANFTEEYILENQTLQIVFGGNEENENGGKLNGMTFDVNVEYDRVNGTKLWIVNNDDYAMTFPNDTNFPQVDDKFALINFDIAFVDETLIYEAEGRLLKKGYELKKKLLKDQRTYEFNLMSSFAMEHTLLEGTKVVVDGAVFDELKTRIIGYEYPLDIPYDTPKIICGETTAYSRLKALEQRLEEVGFSGAMYSSGGGGGSNVVILTSNSSSQPTDQNVMSALRTLNEIEGALNNQKVEYDRHYLIKDSPDTTENVQGAVSFEKGVGVGGNLEVEGDASVEGEFEVGGDTQLGGDLGVGGDAVVNGGATVYSGMTVIGNNSSNNGLDVGNYQSHPLFPGAAQGVRITKQGFVYARGMELSESLTVPELRYNRATTIVGANLMTQGGGIIERVETLTSTTGRVWLKLEDGEAGAVMAGDLCVGVWHMTGSGSSTNSSTDEDNHHGLIKYKGFTTVYFQITSVPQNDPEISGTNTNADSHYFEYQLRASDDTWVAVNAHPQQGMHFAGYTNIAMSNGSYTHPERQSFSIQTKDYLVSVREVRSWEYGSDNIYYVRGLLVGFDYIMGTDSSTGQPYASGAYFAPNETGLILGNIYFYGSIRNFERNIRTLTVEQTKGGWLLSGEEDVVTIRLVDGNGTEVSGDEITKWELYMGGSKIADLVKDGGHTTYTVSVVPSAVTTYTAVCTRSDGQVMRILFTERPTPARGENAVMYKLVASPELLGLTQDGSVYPTTTIRFTAYKIDGNQQSVIGSSDPLYNTLKVRPTNGTAFALSSTFTWTPSMNQVTFELIDSSNSNAFLTDTTVKMIPDGQDGASATFDLYQLAPTADMVKVDKNGGFSRAGFVCNATHVWEDGTETIYRHTNWPEDLAIRYTINTKTDTFANQTPYVDEDGIHEDGTIVVTDGGGNRGVFISSAIRNVTQTNGGTNLYLYLWQNINSSWVQLQSVTIPFLEDGADGTDALVVDIDNEMDAVPMTYQGAVASQSVVSTGIKIFSGSTAQTITSLSVGTLPTGVTATTSTSGTSGTVTVTITQGASHANDTFLIPITAACAEGSQSVVFTVAGVRAGADGENAVIYQLIPSANQIVKKKNGTREPSSAITTSVVKKDGSSVTTVSNLSTEGLTLFVKIDNGTETAGTSITPSQVTSKAQFILKKSSVVIDRETIPVVEDGTDGASPCMLDLTNEADILLYNADGTQRLSSAVETTWHLYKGGEDISSSSGVGTPTLSTDGYCTASFKSGTSNRTIQVTAMTAASSNVTISVSYDGLTYVSVFTVKRIIGTEKNELLCTPKAVAYNSTTGTGSTQTIKVQAVHTDVQAGTRQVLNSLGSLYLYVYPDGVTLTTQNASQYNKTSSYSNGKYEFSASPSNQTGWNILLLSGVFGTGMTWDTEFIPISKSANGANGTSITGVTDKYAASASKTTAPTTWQDTVPELSAATPYLWNYEIISYSSGSSTSTLPAVIGVFGKDGRGITSIVNHYLATNVGTGVTPSTSGWTDSVQTISASQPYLWKYETVNYSDGTHTDTTPTVIGHWGADGESAVSVYLTNEMDSVPMASDGKVLVQRDITTKICVYKGSTAVALTGNPTYSTLPTGVTLVSRNTNGTITFRVAKDATLTGDKATITITAPTSEGSFASVLTIQGVRAGADGTFSLYQLAPRADMIKVSEDETFSRVANYCNVSHITNTGTSTIYRTALPSNLSMYYTINTNDTTKANETLYANSSGVVNDGTIVVVDSGNNQGLFMSSAIYAQPQSSGGTFLVLYLWDGDALVDTQTIPFVSDGKTSLSADLTNEVDAVAMSNLGEVVETTVVSTTISLFLGTEKQTLTANPTYQFLTQGVSQDITVATSRTNDNKDGVVAVTVPNDVTLPENTLVVRIFATCAKGTRTVDFTIVGVNAGDDAAVYRLVPSANQIVRHENATTPSGNVTCSVIKSKGESQSTVSSGYTLKMSVDGGSQQTYSPVAASSVTDKVEFFLYIGSTLVDKESVPVVKDGLTAEPNVLSGGDVQRAIRAYGTPSYTESTYGVYVGWKHMELNYVLDTDYVFSMDLEWNQVVAATGATSRVRILLFENESGTPNVTVFYKAISGTGSGRFSYNVSASAFTGKFSANGKYKCRVELAGAESGAIFYSNVKAEVGSEATVYVDSPDNVKNINPNIINYTQTWKDKDGMAKWDFVAGQKHGGVITFNGEVLRLNNNYYGAVADVQSGIRSLETVTVPANEYAVLSVDMKYDGTEPASLNVFLYNSTNALSWTLYPDSTAATTWPNVTAKQPLTKDWKRFYFFVDGTSAERTFEVRFKHNGAKTTGGTSSVLCIQHAKLETGMFPTSWVISESDKVGQAGLPGADSVPAVFCGEWSSSALYYYDDVRRDIVLYNGSYYAVKTKGTSVSSLPTNTNDWEAFQGEFKNVATDIMIAADVLSQRGWFDNLVANNIVATNSDFQDVIIRGVLSKMITLLPNEEFFTAGGDIQVISERKYTGLANSTFEVQTSRMVQYLNVWRCGDVVEVSPASGKIVYLMLPTAWYDGYNDADQGTCYMCPGKGGTMYDFSFYGSGASQHGFRMDANSDVLTRSFDDTERPFTFDDMRRLVGRKMVFRNIGAGIVYVCAARYKSLESQSITEWPPTQVTMFRLANGEMNQAECVADTNISDVTSTTQNPWYREGYHWEFFNVGIKMLQ